MSNISITGNEAQFNENVTFLKDVNISGFLTLPSQELSLNILNVPDIRGVLNYLHLQNGFIMKVFEYYSQHASRCCAGGGGS